jgi:putative protein-disulfide isomerase
MSDVAILHLIVDPLCGWTYAAAPLFRQAMAQPGLRLKLHAGGLFVGSQRKAVDAAFRQQLQQFDRQIAAISGQPFAPAYADVLLQQADFVLDSLPPIRALLAGAALGADPVLLLERMQQHYYQHGRNITETAVLVQIAVEAGLLAADFHRTYLMLEPALVTAHLQQSRQLLQQIGGQGYPSAALVTAAGQWQPIDLASYYQQPAAFGQFLQQWLAQQQRKPKISLATDRVALTCDA